MKMMKAKSLAAGAIALTVALGGGALWAGQYVHAASPSPTSTPTPTETTTEAPKAADGTQTKPDGAQKSRSHGQHGGKRGGFGFGHIEQQLAVYLGLTEAELRTKLESETLAEVAAGQGKTRETLKAQLIEWLETAQAEKAAKADANSEDTTDSTRPAFDAAAAADKLLDSQSLGKQGARGGKGDCAERPESADTGSDSAVTESTTTAS